MREAVTARRRSLRRRRAAAADREEEAALEALLVEQAVVTRPNTIAILSPKGGVGKTTCTFLLGSLLASTANLRCVAVDANPDFGTLGRLVPESTRVKGRLGEVFAPMDGVESAEGLKPLVVARLPTRLHLILAPPDAGVTPAITPELLSPLTAFLGRFYDIILLDLGTRITGPLGMRALEEADQRMVVSTPDFVTASTVLGALSHLDGRRLTMVFDQAPRLPDETAREEIEDELSRRQVEQHAIVPFDARLRAMLETSTYDLEALDRDTRMSIRRLGLAAARWLI